ncbi:hypothetical protein LTS07_007817 [Exophiala sideris]|uniref:DUF7779 domain-containing protein n=1 Tax=Exophiala sideris TaxID=1016849 RepID=A0ABR0JGM9_9EURO|nr:hypothetical protein LTS07_007817 [Exophiala sideris]KAK5063662.1 hypothetical protein LTR69_004368 [Exophiala sideris]KAK5176398.1 hypothetical protein LTR44_011082 [Eurotiomycetes sp. CCFEE 6388]
MKDLWQRAIEPGGRVALVGLGGIGKTQVAIEYAYRVQDESPKPWVFWVHASSRVRFEESYKDIAQRLQLAGWQDPKADILGMVHNWLSDENNSRRTMVVDNADDEQVMFKQRKSESNSEGLATFLGNRSLADYLPSSSNGSIVTTTRNRKVAEGLIEYAEDILDLKPMDIDEAVALLTKKLRKLEAISTEDDFASLAQQLDCMPLALSQAAAYLIQRAPRMTLSSYLGELRGSDDGRARLLQTDIRDPRRDGKASNSIITTWYVSFEHIQHTHHSAARLLWLMSLFDREGIPDHLLRRQYLVEWSSEDKKGEESPERQREMDFEDDIATLRAYSLIGLGTNAQLFEMHRLVQFSTRKWLGLRGELENWQRQYVDIIYQTFPTPRFENWSTCQGLLPHVQLLIYYRTNEASYRRKRAAILYRAAWYAKDRGIYGVAEVMAGVSVAEREALFGKIILEHYLAWAEEMHQQALKAKEKILGVDHNSTLFTMNDLALVLQAQGHYKQSEKMYRQALTGKEKILGMDHDSTLKTMSNLANVLRAQGNYKQSEELHRQALTAREKRLGVDHPSTLMSIDNLAKVLREKGEYKQAEEMSRRALTGREKVLGMNHSHTVTSIGNLAVVLQKQGKYKQAEEMHRLSLTSREKLLLAVLGCTALS